MRVILRPAFAGASWSYVHEVETSIALKDRATGNIPLPIGQGKRHKEVSREDLRDKTTRKTGRSKSNP